MAFGTAQKSANCVFPVMSYNNKEVELVETYKYLGIQLDSYLRFDKHVDFIKCQLYAEMKTRGRINQFIPNDIALSLYLNYGDIVYNAMSADSANQLQVIQTTV